MNEKETAQKIVDLTGYGQALHINDILPDLRNLVASAVEAERARISDEIIKAIGASKLGILKNKTTLEVLKDILAIINPSKE